MKFRKSNAEVTAAFVGVFIGAFLLHLWFFFAFHASRPRQIMQEVGFFNESNNHGSHVYISNSDITLLSLLSLTAFAAIGIVTIAYPKEATPPWIGDDLGRRQYIISRNNAFWKRHHHITSIMVVTAILFFEIFRHLGPLIADFVVSRDIVIRFG